MKVVGVENCLVIIFKTIFCYQKQEKQGKQEKNVWFSVFYCSEKHIKDKKY